LNKLSEFKKQWRKYGILAIGILVPCEESGFKIE